jgi:two-component system, OmpR family, KDP operon response regulator KdpE
MSAGKILVVDDEPQIRRVMRATLAASGYEVDDARTGEEALSKIHAGRYAVMLLDVNLGDSDGIEICRTIRRERPNLEPAIIMLTVRNTERDKVQALDAGADDYVTKPFGTPELLARIRAAIRRMPTGAASMQERLILEGITIDFAAREVTGRNRNARLTVKELDLLSYLASHSNRTLSHRELLQAVWGPEYGDEQEYLRVFVNRLRRKIEPDPSKPKYLLTEPWVGYRFRLLQ